MVNLLGDFTETYDMDIPRVDVVGKAANGRKFVLMKAADGGLIDPDTMADLLKADESPEVVTVTGSPAAIARMIHGAAVRKESDDVAKETPMSTTTDVVTKADDEPVGPVEPDGALPDGDPTDPGSPAWEAIDAATAREGIALLGRTKAVINLLATREGLEGLAEHAVEGADASWDLMDACDAIDYAVSVLAVFAANEDLEGQAAAQEIAAVEAVGKAVQLVKSALEPLTVLEGLAPIVKAGRVLSAANESAIRGAVESLSNVLASLPAAPAADDVTKAEPEEAPMAATPTITVPVVAEVTVTKAKGDPVTVVFDQNGKPLGVIDPADLVPITGPAGDTPTEPDGDEPPAADDTPAEPTTTVDTAAAPAPADDATTIPGTDTVQAPTDTTPDDDTVTKADVDAALEEVRTQLAKQVEENSRLAGTVTTLQEHVAKLAAEPDDDGPVRRRSPLLNGSTGTPQAVLPTGTPEERYAALQKAADEETDPIKKRAALNGLLFQQIKDRFTN